MQFSFGLLILVQVFGSDDLRAHLERLIQAEDETDTAAESGDSSMSHFTSDRESVRVRVTGFWEYTGRA